MKISGVDITGSTPVTSKKSSGAGKKGRSAASSEGDKIDISDSGGVMKSLRAQYAQTPDIRMDKASALKERIDQGNYHPEASDIADAILRHVRKMADV